MVKSDNEINIPMALKLNSKFASKKYSEEDVSLNKSKLQEERDDTMSHPYESSESASTSVETVIKVSSMDNSEYQKKECGSSKSLFNDEMQFFEILNDRKYPLLNHHDYTSESDSILENSRLENVEDTIIIILPLFKEQPPVKVLQNYKYGIDLKLRESIEIYLESSLECSTNALTHVKYNSSSLILHMMNNSNPESVPEYLSLVSFDVVMPSSIAISSPNISWSSLIKQDNKEFSINKDKHGAKSKKETKLFNWSDDSPDLCAQSKRPKDESSLLTSLSLYFNHRVFNPQYHSTFSGFDSSTTLKRSILNQIGNESGSTSCIRSRIHRLLTEIEEKTLRLWKETNSKIALVRGQSSIIARDFSTYQAVLENLGFIVKTWSSGNNSDNLRPHLLICFTFSDPLNCWQKSNRQGVKLNKLPSLRSNIWQREAICSLLRNSNVSCYVLPSDYDVFISSATSSNLNWLVQLQSGENWKVLEASDIIKQMDEFRSIRAIIQPYPSLPLTILGQPVTLRIYILITSTFPLRAYLHTQGIVYRRHLVGNRTLRKIPSQVWNMNQFWNHLRIKNGDHSVRLAIRRLFGVLVQILLSLETLLSTEDNAQRRCQQCFQLLGFDILFDISLHPYVVEVNGQPDMRHTDNVMTNNIKRGVVSDTTNLVFAIDSVSDRVTEALMRLDPEAIGILGINCRVNHEFCLSYTDLNLLLDTQREYLNRGGFIQLYPSSSSTNDSFLMNVLLRMKDVSLKNQKTEDQWINRKESTINSEDYRMSRCSEDPSTKPYISDIQTLPYLEFHPPFSPYYTDYVANVTYDQLILRISASCQFCRCEVRLDEKDGPASATNYTLGVGENKIYLLVIDISHSKPWLVSTYTLTVYRLPLVHGEAPFDPSESHQVCSLIQANYGTLYSLGTSPASREVDTNKQSG
ncbi:uncharacterized protein LOC111634775 [Centruroides sculpturatus]|uniref:uncharacterized protein LOC111634775 n=1 Tax=Centruroides sculpturatus TaxID=218467 RepID=UPI000C6D741F|nr:uncharacterized protein LOC111634775 [Centruroides sculpturatus]